MDIERRLLFAERQRALVFAHPHGYVVTREAAMSAFAKSWRRSGLSRGSGGLEGRERPTQSRFRFELSIAAMCLPLPACLRASFAVASD
jgi:hypothetical protein